MPKDSGRGRIELHRDGYVEVGAGFVNPLAWENAADYLQWTLDNFRSGRLPIRFQKAGDSEEFCARLGAGLESLTKDQPIGGDDAIY